MTKRNFIALADHIKQHNKTKPDKFTPTQLQTLAMFCLSQNTQFNEEVWMHYLATEDNNK